MKLTPTQRDALLAEYESGADPLPVLAERWGVSMTTINNYRLTAGLSGRAVVNRDLIPVEPVDVSVKILPVYPVRLVSRPGEKPSLRDLLPPRCPARSWRGEQCALPEGHVGSHHNEPCSAVWGGDDGRS